MKAVRGWVWIFSGIAHYLGHKMTRSEKRVGTNLNDEEVTSDSHLSKISWLISSAVYEKCERPPDCWIYNFKISPRQCVVQDCDRISDPEVEISMHTSPLEGAVLSKWKRIVFQLRKNFKPIGQFGVCSLHFTKDCFTCAVRICIKETRR